MIIKKPGGVKMKNKIYISTLVIFWMTVAFFIITILNIFVLSSIDLFNRYLFFASGIVLLCLGIALIVLAVKANFTRISKAFFILTGASAIGIVAGSVLHNLVYALFIKIFGEGFWGYGGDEPVFFIFATIICPLALLTGIIGCIVLIARKEALTQIKL
jgi:cytochrome b561